MGPDFFRFDVTISGDPGGGKELVDDFMKKLIRSLSDKPSLPSTLEILRQKALQPCEVNYQSDLLGKACSFCSGCIDQCRLGTVASQ